MNQTNTQKPLKEFIDQEKLREDLAFGEYDLSDAVSIQAGLFSFYASMHTNAMLQTEKSRSYFELVEAQLDTKIRIRASKAGEKITEKQITNKIRMQSMYRIAEARYFDAKFISRSCREAQQAIKNKGDMLVQAAKAKTIEMQGQMRFSGNGGGQSPSQRIQEALDK